jgi:hypothetical protein
MRIGSMLKIRCVPVFLCAVELGVGKGAWLNDDDKH